MSDARNELDLERAIEANHNIEVVARWAIANSFATGHGDTMHDLLNEIGAQIAELRAIPKLDHDTVMAIVVDALTSRRVWNGKTLTALEWAQTYTTHYFSEEMANERRARAEP